MTAPQDEEKQAAAPSIEGNLQAVRARIEKACERAGRSPGGVMLIAVTKLATGESIRKTHRLGVRHFGENRVQDAQRKIESLSDLDPRPAWHFVGHLQTNKVGTALGLFDTIQSVDSLRLARAIDSKASQRTPILLEINFTTNEARHGFAWDDVVPTFEAITQLAHVDVKGLMTVAPQAPDAEEVRPVFKRLRLLADALHLEHLSMGMTDDFEVAIEEGATMVRIGRGIFGSNINNQTANHKR